MSLLEILEKRKKGEPLTEEEVALLAEYDETLKLQTHQMDLLKTEKETYETKFLSAQKELEDKIRILSEKEEEVNKVISEKKEIEDIYNTAKNAEEAKIILERAKADKEKAEAIKKVEEERAKKEKLEQEKYDKMLQELAELKEKNAIANLKEKIMLDKVQKPYLETGLNSILANINSKPVAESEMAYNLLLTLYNHDSEMEKIESAKKAGSSILSSTEVKLVENTKLDTSEDKLLEFASKIGFKVKK